jgi:LPS export ABC transporter protein LptC
MPAGLPPAELRGVIFEGFSGGIQDAEVRAVEARIDTEARVALLRGVDIGFSDERRGRVEIRAEQGSLDLDSEDFFLSGGVVGRTALGDRFSTAKLEYRRDGQKLRAVDPVRLDRGSMQLYAEGMEFDLEDRRMVLTGKVEALVGGGDPAEAAE